VAPGRQLERDRATEGVADDVGTLDAPLGEVRDEVLDRVVHVVGDVARIARRLTEPREVHADHVVLLCELVEDRVPRLAAVADPMDQHEGLAGALAVIDQFREKHAVTSWERDIDDGT